MGILKLKRREEPEILFGLKLPLIVKNFYMEITNKEKAEKIIKDTFKIKEDRMINLIDVQDKNGKLALLLVIYDNFPSKKEKRKLNLEIDSFDFNIFEFDYNKEIDVEVIIQNVKNRF